MNKPPGDFAQPPARGAGWFVSAFAGDLLVLAFAVVAVVASFRSGSASEAEVYYFPRLVSVLMLFFALANAAQNFRRTAESPLSVALCRRLLPGGLIAVAYIYICDIVGFYLSALSAFVLLSAVYSDAPLDRRRWATLAFATAVVMGGVWLLFDVILRVQTPEPFWID